VKPIVCAIDAERIDEVWPLVEPHITIGVEAARGELTVYGVHQALVDGDMLLLMVYQDRKVIAALGLDITVHMSGKRTIGVTVCAGSQLDEWMVDIIEALDQLGAEMKCDAVVIIGRPGWTKKLAEHGYSRAYVAMSKEI